MMLINPRCAVLALSLALVSVSAHAFAPQDLTISSGETYTNQNTMDNLGKLENNGTLVNTGTLNNDGTLTYSTSNPLATYGSLENNGTLDNFGTLNNIHFSALGNNGTLNNNVGGTMVIDFNFSQLFNTGTLNNNGTLTNSGTLDNFGTLNNAGTLTNNGTLTNSGTLLNNNGGTVFVMAGSLVNAATMTNDGTFNLTGGTVDATTIHNNGTFNLTGGTLNVDTFNGHLNNTGGTVGPGHSPGTTTINGDYSKDEFSTLHIEIAGTMAGSEYDVLNVTGDASLNDGVLRLDLLDGFEPVIGDAFVILQSANIIGAFGGIYSTTALGEGLRWDLDYSNIGGNDFLTARVSAGPIPAATTVPVPLPLWLFVVLSALIGGLGYRRLYIA